MSTAIKHPVPDRVKPVICNFWHPGTLTPSPERQSARMSKITNDGLTQSGTGWFNSSGTCWAAWWSSMISTIDSVSSSRIQQTVVSSTGSSQSAHRTHRHTEPVYNEVGRGGVIRGALSQICAPCPLPASGVAGIFSDWWNINIS